MTLVPLSFFLKLRYTEYKQRSLTIIGNLLDTRRVDDILFVVYTERVIVGENRKSREITRLISARLATNFERGVYYGKRS